MKAYERAAQAELNVPFCNAITEFVNSWHVLDDF
jgi:hypothetical protein